MWTASEAEGWQFLSIGGGGLVTQLAISADGTMFAGCDSSGMFKWNAPVADRWNQLVTVDAVPGKVVGDFEQGFGCEGNAVAPTDQNQVWWLWNGELRHSTDKGVLFDEDTSYGHLNAHHGGFNRSDGPHVLVDPFNANVVYASTAFEGLKRTTTGFGGFATLSGMGCSAGHTEGMGINGYVLAGTSVSPHIPAVGSFAFVSNVALNIPASPSRLITIISSSGEQMIGTCPLGSSGTSFTFNCLDTDATAGLSRSSWSIYLVFGTRENSIITDASTVTLGTGLKTFNNLSAAFGVSVGSRICVWNSNDPTASMYGTVDASSTGSQVVLNVTSFKGSGSKTGWHIGGTNYEGGGHKIAFDINAGTVTDTIDGNVVTRAKRIYVGTWGVGMYMSDDGGLTWTFLDKAGMPRYPTRMMCDLQGVLWICDGQKPYFTTNACKYSGGLAGTFTNWMRGPNTSGGVKGYTNVAIDYLNSATTARVCFIQAGGPTVQCSLSTDAGATWNETTTATYVSSGDVDYIKPWLDGAGAFFAGCDAFFDPIVSGKLWMAAQGVWYTTPKAVGQGTALTVTQQTRGIEMFINIAIMSTPYTPGGVQVATWDFPLFYTENFSVSPATYNGTTNPLILLTRCYSMDYLWSDPSKIAVCIQDGSGFSNDPTKDFSGSAINGGKVPGDFTPFATRPNIISPAGYQLAYSSENDIVVVPTHNNNLNRPAMTRNGGAAWTVPSIDVTSGSYNNSTGVLTLNLASAPAFPTVDSPGVGNLVDVSGLVDTVYTITSGTYNSGTGAVALTLSGSPGFASGTTANITIASGTGAFASLAGAYSVTVSGNVVSYTAATGLGATTVTGGTVIRDTNGMNGRYPLLTCVGSTITYNVGAGYGVVVISDGAVAGTTWVNIAFPGSPAGSGWGASTNARTLSRIITCDKGNGDVFLFNWDYDGAGGERMYKWTRASNTWSACANPPGAAPALNYINAKLKAVDGKTGHMFWTDGQESGGDPLTSQLFAFTNDGWATKNTIPNFSEVHAFGFGAPFGAHPYPSIYCVGWKSGTYAVYMCKNWDPANVATGTWTQIGDAYPRGIMGYIADIDGDKVTAGKVYLQTIGFGVFYGTFT